MCVPWWPAAIPISENPFLEHQLNSFPLGTAIFFQLRQKKSTGICIILMRKTARKVEMIENGMHVPCCLCLCVIFCILWGMVLWHMGLLLCMVPCWYELWVLAACAQATILYIEIAVPFCLSLPSAIYQSNLLLFFWSSYHRLLKVYLCLSHAGNVNPIKVEDSLKAEAPTSKKMIMQPGSQEKLKRSQRFRNSMFFFF